MSEMFQAAIQRLIPHRYPFLLVDRVTDFVPGQSITGIKTLTVNEAASLGYSPDEPMAPATLVIEMVTQLGAILVYHRE